MPEIGLECGCVSPDRASEASAVGSADGVAGVPAHPA
jgi:hypothetical protein